MARARRTAIEALLEQAQAVRGWLETLPADSATRSSVAPGRTVGDVIRDLNALLTTVDERHSQGSLGPDDLIGTMIIDLIGYADDLNRSLPELDPIPLHRAALGRCIRMLAGDPAGALSRPVGRGPDPAVRGRAVRDGRSRPDPHPRHPTERGRDRPAHVSAAGDRPAQLGRGDGDRNGARLRPPRRSVVRAPAPDLSQCSEDGQHPGQFHRRDLAAVLLELGPLVAQEEVEDVLAEGLGDQIRPLHQADGLVQVPGQR